MRLQLALQQQQLRSTQFFVLLGLAAIVLPDLIESDDRAVDPKIIPQVSDEIDAEHRPECGGVGNIRVDEVGQQTAIHRMDQPKYDEPGSKNTAGACSATPEEPASLSDSKDKRSADRPERTFHDGIPECIEYGRRFAFDQDERVVHARL